MNEITDLSHEIYYELTNKLERFGTYPGPDSRLSLKELTDTLVSGLAGSLESKYYLSSIDPGIGKTQSLATLISVWTSSSYLLSGSILVAFHSKREIEEFVKRLDINAADFACFTRDNDINALGRGKEQRHLARVLLTTQQMIRSRVSDRSFSAAHDFFYNDGPRTLRIWDESFTLAQPITASADDLQRLVGPIRRRHPQFATDLQLWLTSLIGTENGSQIALPKGLTDRIDDVKADLVGKRIEASTKEAEPLCNLADAWKQGLRVINSGGRAGLSLVGSTRRLPADFAPAIITDASGRVRGTYRAWEQADDKLVRLRSYANDYRRVTFHVCETPCGKDKLADPAVNRAIFRNISNVIEEKPGEDWLLVSVMPTSGGLDVKSGVEESLTSPANLHFLHWGAHHATNKYNHVKNIIIVGSFLYSKAGYAALEVAATGAMTESSIETGGKALSDSELQHNILQAVMRGNARRSSFGIAGECNVYLVVSKNRNMYDLLETTFPACKIKDWHSGKVELSPNQTKLILHLEGAFRKGATRIVKADARNAIGVEHRQAMTKLLEGSLMEGALAARSIGVGRKEFYLIPKQSQV